MSRISQFLNLSAAERTILIMAVPLVAAIRLSLTIVPFPTLYRSWSAALPRLARTGNAVRASPERIVWLVAVASRWVPGAHCLTRAAAAQLLLARSGQFVEFRIGVRKDGDALKAHAWLEHDGVPILESKAELSGFTPFPPAIASPLDRRR